MRFLKSWLKFGSEIIWMNQELLSSLVPLPAEVLGASSLKFTFQLENGDFKSVISPGPTLDPFYFWKTQATKKDLLIHHFGKGTYHLGGFFPGISCHLSGEADLNQDNAGALNRELNSRVLNWGVADFILTADELKSEMAKWELVQVEEWTAQEPLENLHLIKAEVLFLDRDNVIVKDVPYNKNPEEVFLMDGISELFGKAEQQGFLKVMVSNQSGVGRGLMTPEEFLSVQTKVTRLLCENGNTLDLQLWAFYHESTLVPETILESMKRKPRGGMFWEAEQKFLVGEKSVMVGDKASDLIAAYWGQVPQKVLLVADGTLQTEKTKLEEFRKEFPDFQYAIADSLREVLKFI